MSFWRDKLKQPGMPLSLGLHGLVLVGSVLTFSTPKPLPDAVEAISVEVIDESQPREVVKGEKEAPKPQPLPRVDRVDQKIEQNAPGEAKKQVNAEATPKPQEETAKEERKEVVAAVPAPPVAPPRPQPVTPPVPQTPKPVQAKPVPAEKTEEEEKADEIIRQRELKRVEEQKKLEEQRRAEERRKRAAEQARLEAQKQQEAERKREQEEERRVEEQRKQADARAAEARQKADEQKKLAQEAAKKAAEERRKREAEQNARNQAAADAARRALLASREAPSNSGNTGQQVSRTPSAGAATATGQRLNPSDRAALAGLLADQIRACWNNSVTSKPNVLPLVRISLGQDGSLQGAPVLTNSSGDPAFRALAESGMRAIRQCAPFRIPSRFAPMYSDWRSTVVQLNPDD
jgi:colicin import membrane protein